LDDEQPRLGANSQSKALEAVGFANNWLQGSGLLASQYNQLNNLGGALGMNEMNAQRGDFWNAYQADATREMFDEQMDFQRDQLEAQKSASKPKKRGGGIGGMLGSIGGTLLGSIAGPIGSAIGGKIGGSLFG
jgi:hypothetical protein